MTTFADLVLRRAGDTKTGLRFEDRTWSWAEVVGEASARASALETTPPPPDRRRHIGLLMENIPDYVFWLCAGAIGGAVVVGLNTSRPPQELADDIVQADIDLVLTEDRHLHLLTDGGVANDLPVLSVDDPAYGQWIDDHRAADLPGARPDARQLALLLFSSGTTGRPKAVVVSQGRLGALGERIVDRISMRRDSVTYLCMPLFHGNAVIMNLVPALATGATVALTRRFSASRFSADVHRFGASYVNYVGRALSYVLARDPDPRDSASTLELAYGTEASEADIRRFAERFGCEVVEGYGLSEGVFRIGRTPGTPVGALGRPQEGVDVRVLDEETGAECPRADFDEDGRLRNPEAVGQMVAMGLGHLFEGYYRNPDAERERVRGADFWSGDLGYRDRDGWFYFAGRSSDWIRVDSENFAAAQVERILQRAPGVASSPVFAVADPRTGDQVMAVVELEQGVAFDPSAFGAFLGRQADLGMKWWPRFVRVVDAVPLTGSGKVDKAPLRRHAWNVPQDVYRRVGRTAVYEPMSARDRRDLEREFVAQGRAALLPAPATADGAAREVV